MRYIVKSVLAAALLAVCVKPAAAATVLTFDDAYSDLGDGGNPATYYSAEGVTISGDYFGVVGGVGNGDPGDWKLGGTNGSAFLGCNDGNSCSPTFSFSSPVQNVSLDIGLANDWSATFTVAGYLDGSLVDSDTVTVSDPGTADGTWDTFALDGAVNSVVVSSSFTSGFAYGLDNFSFTAAAVPEPASWLLLATAFGFLGTTMYLRRAGNAAR